jgi:hypothetical protein
MHSDDLTTMRHCNRFVSIFALLGVWPLVFASLLYPLKPKNQGLPLMPFVGTAMMLVRQINPMTLVTYIRQKRHGSLTSQHPCINNVIVLEIIQDFGITRVFEFFPY